jgi:dynein heavy chain
MSEELDEVYIKILNNNVPDLWHKVSYPSVKPLSGWILNFLARLKFISDWIEHG